MKVCTVKAMVFPEVMYGCESWTLKKVDHWRTDAFELWCWRLLGVPWTVRGSNKSILKEISPEYSLEGPILKLRLQSFGQLMQRADSLEKTLMLGKTEGRRRQGCQMTRWLDGITNSVDIRSSKFRKMVKGREVWRAVVHGVAKSWTRLNHWTTIQFLTESFIGSTEKEAGRTQCLHVAAGILEQTDFPSLHLQCLTGYLSKYPLVSLNVFQSLFWRSWFPPCCLLWAPSLSNTDTPNSCWAPAEAGHLARSHLLPGEVDSKGLTASRWRGRTLILGGSSAWHRASTHS